MEQNSAQNSRIKFKSCCIPSYHLFNTDMREFESTIRANNPAWFRDEMQLSAYVFNGLYKCNSVTMRSNAVIILILLVRLGFRWGKRRLTWAIVRESDKVPTDRVVDAASSAFGKWSAVTPLRFTPLALVSPDQSQTVCHQPDHKIPMGFSISKKMSSPYLIIL